MFFPILIRYISEYFYFPYYVMVLKYIMYPQRTTPIYNKQLTSLKWLRYNNKTRRLMRNFTFQKHFKFAQNIAKFPTSKPLRPAPKIPNKTQTDVIGSPKPLKKIPSAMLYILLVIHNIMIDHICYSQRHRFFYSENFPTTNPAYAVIYVPRLAKHEKGLFVATRPPPLQS